MAWWGMQYFVCFCVVSFLVLAQVLSVGPDDPFKVGLGFVETHVRI
jgi:hypothetical protein